MRTNFAYGIFIKRPYPFNLDLPLSRKIFLISISKPNKNNLITKHQKLRDELQLVESLKYYQIDFCKLQ